jgi:hypothetical protein
MLLHAEPAHLRTVSHTGRLILSRAKSAFGTGRSATPTAGSHYL